MADFHCLLYLWQNVCVCTNGLSPQKITSIWEEQAEHSTQRNKPTKKDHLTKQGLIYARIKVENKGSKKIKEDRHVWIKI